MTDRTLARLATGIENRDPQALATLRGMPHGHARIIGITGPPGAGKSTLVDALALALRQQNRTVAILAVDPSSRLTGGAILGDRIRMQRHHADSGIFIRSIATRGESGGIARATADLARLMDAAGKDYVLVETVGVGQDEIAVARIAHVIAVVLVPGMGDDIQAIKSGILEIADLFVINKSDHPGADRLAMELHAERDAPILRTVATEGTGVPELLAAIEKLPPRSIAAAGSAATLDHIAISVQSLADAIPFYESLGLAVTHRQFVPAEKVNAAILTAHIELLEATAADSPISKRPHGLHHIALRVRDLAATVAHLQSRGARILNEPRPGAGGHIYVFVHPATTGGILLELIQEQTL
jgi:LAO/AO transport system kinase